MAADKNSVTVIFRPLSNVERDEAVRKLGKPAIALQFLHLTKEQQQILTGQLPHQFALSSSGEGSHNHSFLTYVSPEKMAIVRYSLEMLEHENARLEVLDSTKPQPQVYNAVQLGEAITTLASQAR